MKNWRRIVVTGLIAGMVAFTGCSSNVPDTNQGNRNGQRVVDAVNNRGDSYRTTRGRTTETRRTDGVRGHRGINRSARRTVNRNDLRTETGSRNITGHNRTVTRSAGTHRAPNHATRNHATRNHGYNRQHGRVGHTFGYGHYGYNDAYDCEAGNYCAGGYDRGQRASTRSNTPTSRPFNPAGINTGINNRVVRSTPVARASAPTSTARKSTATTGTATRNTSKSTTKTTTRSTATPRPAAAIAPKVQTKPVAAKPRTSTATPQTRTTRSARPASTNVNTVNNPSNQVVQTPKVHETHVTTQTTSTNPRNARQANATRRAQTSRKASNRDGRTYMPKAAMRSAGAVQRTNRDTARVNSTTPIRNARDAQKARERGYNRSVHQMFDINNPVTSNTSNITRNIRPNASATRNSHRASNAISNNMAFNHAVNSDGNSRLSAGNAQFAGFTGVSTVHGGDEYAINDNYAFFKRNKADETTPIPANPEVTPGSSRNDDNIHDIDHHDIHGVNASQLSPSNNSLDRQPAPARRAAGRAMK